MTNLIFSTKQTMNRILIEICENLSATSNIFYGSADLLSPLYKQVDVILLKSHTFYFIKNDISILISHIELFQETS